MQAKNERGVFHSLERAHQLIRFDGMRFRANGTPTDIDAVIDIQGRAFIFWEVKLAGQELPLGQRLMLEHLQDGLNKARIPSVIIVGEHQCAPGIDIYLADLPAVRYRVSKEKDWIQPPYPINCYQLAKHFLIARDIPIS